MSEKTKYRCDVCGHAISEGHQEFWMSTISINHEIQADDGSSAGHDNITNTYHVHNKCMRTIWDILEKHKK